MSHNAKWEAKRAAELVGWTVAETFTDPKGDSWGLIFTKPGAAYRVIVWVDSDEEGNAAGHFNINHLTEEQETGGAS